MAISLKQSWATLVIGTAKQELAKTRHWEEMDTVSLAVCIALATKWGCLPVRNC